MYEYFILVVVIFFSEAISFVCLFLFVLMNMMNKRNKENCDTNHDVPARW